MAYAASGNSGNCPFCSQSLAGGHDCPHKPPFTDVEELSSVNYGTPQGPLTPEEAQSRKEALWEGRQVSAAYITSAPDSPDQYWKQWYGNVAEWGDVTDAGYPKMPDDYTPRMTLGQSTTGHRRTHRMKYTAPDGFQIRMPSATAVRRFAVDNSYTTESGEKRCRTFEMPVSVIVPSDPPREALVSMRCTWNGPGSWHVEPPVGEAMFGQTAEAVAAVLEARRPSLALREHGNLNAQHMERIRSAGRPILTPSTRSSFISGVSVLGKRDTIVTRIRDKHGRERIYGYEMPEGTPQMRDAFIQRMLGRDIDPVTKQPREHIGVVYNRELKGRQQRVEVSLCPRCQCVYETGRGHKCRIRTRRPAQRMESMSDRERRAAMGPPAGNQ
jgi:hypothetical protein